MFTIKFQKSSGRSQLPNRRSSHATQWGPFLHQQTLRLCFKASKSNGSIHTESDHHIGTSFTVPKQQESRLFAGCGGSGRKCGESRWLCVENGKEKWVFMFKFGVLLNKLHNVYGPLKFVCQIGLALRQSHWVHL